MDQRALFTRILNLSTPWHVEDVELDGTTDIVRMKVYANWKTRRIRLWSLSIMGHRHHYGLQHVETARRDGLRIWWPKPKSHPESC